MQLLHISVCVYNSDSGENGNHKQPTILQCCCSKWTGSDSNVVDDVVNVFLPCMYSSTLEKEHFVFFFFHFHLLTLVTKVILIVACMESWTWVLSFLFRLNLELMI